MEKVIAGSLARYCPPKDQYDAATLRGATSNIAILLLTARNKVQ
jgi:hypothetical protein